MSRMMPTTAALVVAAVLTALAPAGAAERRADGLRSNAGPTEFSSQRRRWRRGYRGRRAYWGRGYGYWGPRYRWRPRYAYWGPRYYGGYYGYPYYWRPRPVFSIGFGFGPRWWW